MKPNSNHDDATVGGRRNIRATAARPPSKPVLTRWQQEFLKQMEGKRTFGCAVFGGGRGRTFATVFFALTCGEAGEKTLILTPQVEQVAQMVSSMEGFSAEARSRVTVLNPELDQAGKRHT